MPNFREYLAANFPASRAASYYFRNNCDGTLAAREQRGDFPRVCAFDFSPIKTDLRKTAYFQAEARRGYGRLRRAAR